MKNKRVAQRWLGRSVAATMALITVLATALTLGLAVSPVCGDATGAASGSLAEQLERLEKQLHADAFAERREATQQLRRLGTKAIPLLRELAEGSSAEARTRALELLAEHYRQSDENLRAAAQAALEQLAQGDGAAARSAQAILHPPAAGNAPPGWNPALRRAIIMNNVRIRQRAAQPAIVPRRNVRIVHQEGQRRITIISGDGGIDIEIQEKKDGKEVVEKFKVKDAAELKQRHPEAHGVLERATGQRPNVRNATEKHLAQFDTILKNLRDRLPEATPQQREILERQIERLEDAQQRLRQQIEAQP